MDLTFDSGAFAELCNSERHLTQRWGPDLGRLVARRLLDLAAVDQAAVGRLPGARVSSANDEIVITFQDTIVIRGVISNSTDGCGATGLDTDCIVITDLDVLGSDQR